MQSAIQKLIAGGKKGDTLLLHYSGHGLNVPDDNGDEADHRDEILCPTNLDWNDPLRDDWLRTTLNKLRAGVSLTVIMDCCHSGTNTRAITPPDAPIIERFLPCPLDLMATESGRKLRGTLRGKLGKAPRGRKRKSDIVHADIQEMLITGCRDTQTSADADIGGTFNGALTYYLVGPSKRRTASCPIENYSNAPLRNSRVRISIKSLSLKGSAPLSIVPFSVSGNGQRSHLTA